MKRARKRRIGKYSLDSMAFFSIIFYKFSIFTHYPFYFFIFFFISFQTNKEILVFSFFFLVINKPITREAKIINNRNLRKKMKLDPLKMDLK